MKRILLIIVLLLIIGCNDTYTGNDDNNKIDCKKLNDSALVQFNSHHYQKAMELIDKAIKCDSTETVYLSNKLYFLHNSGMYRECIEFIDKNKSYFSDAEASSGKAINYFYLKDTANFRFYKERALKQAQKQFEKNKNEDNLISYLTMIKMYDEKNGEKRVNEVLNSNKKYFTRPGMDTIMIEALKKTPTFRIQKYDK
jgi:tetratricopeptide (TPR) repeat protein